jgi:heat shock protein HslJ
MKYLIASIAILIVGCSNTRSVLNKNNYSNPIESTWVLKSVLMGDAMDMPCGFSNEGKIKEMNLTLTSEKEISGEKKKLFGQSSVNDFMGWYTILSFDEKTKTGKIKFEPLVSTKMASENTTLMECENRYLSYLEKMVDFKLVNNQLQLINTTKFVSNSNLYPSESYSTILYFEKK